MKKIVIILISISICFGFIVLGVSFFKDATLPSRELLICTYNPGDSNKKDTKILKTINDMNTVDKVERILMTSTSIENPDINFEMPDTRVILNNAKKDSTVIEVLIWIDDTSGTILLGEASDMLYKSLSPQDAKYLTEALSINK